MMASTAQISTLLVLLCASGAFAKSGRNPCHPDRNRFALGASCENIIIPPGLCQKCQLSTYDSSGSFDDCTAIYKITEQGCRSELQKYVDLNPCDTKRPAQLASINNEVSRSRLDYFVYSVCEECCDCIPRGARKDQYAQRRAARTQRGLTGLTSLDRGNCPAHARFDICKVWPEVRSVATSASGLKPTHPKICPLLETWFNSPDSQGWPSNDNTQMNWRIRRFLGKLNNALRCRRQSTWGQCIDLEVAQSRI